jgi:Protein of unknown function (DUF1616)
MYRNRNLDIAIAAIVAILGGLAAAKNMPGQVTIPLGIALFFAPGYLWSEAILSQRLPGIERAMTTVGMAFIFPILGGFLFYGLHIPLFKSSWVGLLVVLTLLGVVAVAIQRLRGVPVGQPQQPRRTQPPSRQGGPVVLHSFIFGLAAVVGIGAVAFSVKNAETQKFPGYTALSMTAVVDNPAARNAANLSDNPTAQATQQETANSLQPKATKAHLIVTNHQGVPEQYLLKLLQKGKVTNTWNITLNDGQTWQKTIAWTTNYSMLADLYRLPNTTTPFHYVNNGTCVSNIKTLPTVLRAEDPCDGKK